MVAIAVVAVVLTAGAAAPVAGAAAGTVAGTTGAVTTGAAAAGTAAAAGGTAAAGTATAAVTGAVTATATGTATVGGVVVTGTVNVVGATAAGGGGATAAAGVGAATGPVGWIILGAEASKSSQHYTFDCWKQVLRDISPEPSHGMLIKDVVSDSRIKAVHVIPSEDFNIHPRLILENVWNELFRIDYLYLTSDIMAAHAVKL